MFMRILTVLNTIISVVVVGGVGFVFFMYGGVVTSNFEHYANLNQIAQDVEMMKGELTASVADETNTLMLKENLPSGYADITGFFSAVDEEESLFVFAATDVNDADLLEFAIPGEEGLYSVRLGCDTGTALEAKPAFKLAGDVYDSIVGSSLTTPVNVRLVFSPVAAEGDCASNVVAAQLLVAEAAEVEEPTAEAPKAEVAE